MRRSGGRSIERSLSKRTSDPQVMVPRVGRVRPAIDIREAIKRLEADGLLERMGPRTVRVAAPTHATQGQRAEVEIALRGKVSRLAAIHATEDDIAHLTELFDAAEDQSRLYNARVEEGLLIDGYAEHVYARIQEFNAGILASTHNPVLVRLFEQTRALSSAERRERSLDRLENDQTFGRARWDSHRRTLDAIRSRDPDLAERTALERAESAMRDLTAGHDEPA
ncbi:FCD domain-containing protein [Gordonia sp. DT30]|uniref:FCD domain-containing protein n=1 Tax=Gordonia sp. DT30 TaxID=3416546 RepID=UPI003CF7A987